MLFNLLGFSGSSTIDGINNLVSEFVQGGDDLSNDSLVAEVLLSSQSDEGLDEGGVLGVGLDSSFDLSEGILELLHLSQWWVGELGDKS